MSPYSAFAVNGATLPNITVASTSSTNPFANTPTFAPVGVFQGQSANIVTFSVDACILDYQHT